MTNLKKDFLEKLGEKISNSEYFKYLNKSTKNMCEEKNVTLTEEQYQSFKSLMICKTILEDEEVFNMVSEEVWQELKNDEDFMNSIKE